MNWSSRLGKGQAGTGVTMGWWWVWSTQWDDGRCGHHYGMVVGVADWRRTSSDTVTEMYKGVSCGCVVGVLCGCDMWMCLKWTHIY